RRPNLIGSSRTRETLWISCFARGHSRFQKSDLRREPETSNTNRYAIAVKEFAARLTARPKLSHGHALQFHPCAADGSGRRGGGCRIPAQEKQVRKSACWAVAQRLGRRLPERCCGR